LKAGKAKIGLKALLDSQQQAKIFYTNTYETLRTEPKGE